MSILVQLAVLIVSLLHLSFLVLEMFLWDKPIGLRIFRQTREQAVATKVLAANQGLYNGFLAAGLIWAWSLGSDGLDIAIFFLACVLLAGIYGSLTVGRKILLVQGLPAFIALVLIYLSEF